MEAQAAAAAVMHGCPLLWLPSFLQGEPWLGQLGFPPDPPPWWRIWCQPACGASATHVAWSVVAMSRYATGIAVRRCVLYVHLQVGICLVWYCYVGPSQSECCLVSMLPLRFFRMSTGLCALDFDKIYSAMAGHSLALTHASVGCGRAWHCVSHGRTWNGLAACNC